MGIRIKNKWGWLITLCTFIIEIPTFGILSSFAVVYIQLIEEFAINDLFVGWIGSLAWTFAFVLAPVCTLLFKKFGHRATALVGVALCSLGLLTSSFLPSPEYLFLTFSFLYGAGANLIENSAINLIAEYFPRKNSARATIFQFLGQSTGFLMMNPLMIYICNEIGWRRAFQILAMLMAFIGSLSAATFRPSPFAKEIKHMQNLANRPMHISHNHGESRIVNEENCETPLQISSKTNKKQHRKQSVVLAYTKSIRETIMVPGTIIWNLGNMLVCIPVSFSYVSLLRYMTTIGISENKTAEIYIILGVFDVLSRMFFFLLGDFLPFTTIYVYPVASIGGGVVMYSLLAVNSFAGLSVFSLVTGIAIGTLTSMNFKIPLDLFGNLLMAEVWSLTIVSVGVGMLIGPVIAGAILDNTESFEIFFHIGAFCYFLAALCFLIIPFWQKYKRWKPRNLHDIQNSESEEMQQSNELHVIPLTPSIDSTHTLATNESCGVPSTSNSINAQSLLTELNECT